MRWTSLLALPCRAPSSHISESNTRKPASCRHVGKPPSISSHFSHPFPVHSNLIDPPTEHRNPFPLHTRALHAHPPNTCAPPVGHPTQSHHTSHGLEAGGPRLAAHHMGCLPALPPGPNRPRPGKGISTPRPTPHVSAGAQAAASGHAAGPPCPRPLPPPPRDTRHHLKFAAAVASESLVATTLYNHGQASPCLAVSPALFNSTQSFSSSILIFYSSSSSSSLSQEPQAFLSLLIRSMEMVDADNLSATELRLGLPGTSSSDDRQKKPSPSVGAKAKRSLDDTRSEAASGTSDTAVGDLDHDDTAAPAPKAQVVGWPPVRAYRKQNTFQAAAAAAKKADQQQQGGGLYVKVSMDGAPYLRKVDLRMYKGYRELRDALDALFTKSMSAAAAEGGGENQHAIAYEDKDGDLMLVGDVPWDMFISSCKKLRIMKGSEAR